MIRKIKQQCDRIKDLSTPRRSMSGLEVHVYHVLRLKGDASETRRSQRHHGRRRVNVVK
jgi:hypothetical protein